MAATAAHLPTAWRLGAGTILLAVLAALAGSAVAQESPLQITDEVMVLVQDGSAIDVFHLFTLVNGSDGSVASPLLPVADAAVRLQVLRLGANGAAVPVVERLEPGETPEDPAPLGPGEARRYQATYRLWQRGTVLPLRRALPYPSDGTVLLTRPGELAVTGVRVARAGRTTAEGVQLDLYQVEATGPVDRWQVIVRPAEVEELPILGGAQAVDPLQPFRAGRGWWFSAAGLLAGAAVLLARGRRRQAPPQAGEREAADPLAPWVQRLAALDLAYQRGQLPEESYRRRRQALLDQYRESQTQNLASPEKSPAQPPTAIDPE